MFGESARISGLGLNNYIARSDSHGLLANPAGIASLQDDQLISTYEERFSRNLQGGSACLTLKNLAFKIDYVTVPGIETRDDYGALIGDFSMKEYHGSVAYGMQMDPALAIGGRANLITKSADKQSNYGGSVMLGALYKLSDPITLGAVVENLGGQSSLNKTGGTNALPVIMRTGCQISPVDDLYVLGGVSYTANSRANWSIGAEYDMLKVVALRVGYDAGRRPFGPVSIGAGVKIKNVVQLDYAFNTHPMLDNSHIVTMTLAFKREKSEAAARSQQPETKSTIVDFGDRKFLKITSGTASFKFGTSDMSDLTEEGRDNVEKARQLIRYLFSLGLCDPAVTIDGNASAEGTPEFNRGLSKKRAEQGRIFLTEALADVIDAGHLKIKLNPQGDTMSKRLEEAFVADWIREHNGWSPNSEQLEETRQSCRNFKINIRINIEKWLEHNGNQEVISRIDQLSKGLAAQLEEAYQAALRDQSKPHESEDK